MSSLSLAQQQVLTLLALGSTVAAAAEKSGVHRNTVANWRRSSSCFRDTWASIQYEQSQYWRDEIQSLGALAVQTLRAVLTDEKASPSIRLRAALAVLDKISNPAPAQPEFAQDRERTMSIDEAHATLLEPRDPILHSAETSPAETQNPAQSGTTTGVPIDGPDPEIVQTQNADAAQFCTRPPNRDIAVSLGPDGLPVFSFPSRNNRPAAQHPAQSVSTQPDPGRNAPCPCGSGAKFKRCCLGKSRSGQTPLARAA